MSAVPPSSPLQAAVEGEARPAPADLRGSREILDVFARELPEALWIREVESRRIVYANQMWERFTGRPLKPGDEHERMLACIHPDDIDRIRRSISNHPHGGADNILRFIRTDGEVRWAHVRTFPLPDGAGAVRWVAGILEDITDRRRDEDKLASYARKLEEEVARYAAMVEQSLVGIYIRSGERFDYASPRLQEILGFGEAQLAGIGFGEIVVEEDRENLLAVFARRRAGERGPIRSSFRIRRGDGALRHLEVESRVLEVAGRLETMGIVQDVTERVLAAEALRLSEERYRLLWENSTDAVVLIGDDGTIRYANSSVDAMFGHAPQDLVGRHIRVLQPPHLQARHDEGMRRFLETGQPRLDWRRTELVARHRDGRDFPIELSFSQLDLGGERLFAAFMRDITERREAQSALQQAFAMMQALSQRVLDIQEDERRAISLELHDDVGQSLVALRIGLHRLAAPLDAGQAKLAAECDDMAAAAQERLRELSTRLHPPQLEALGLVEALRALAERHAAITGLDLRCDFPDDTRPALASEVEMACYRICQEALNNATRHARARVVRIAVRALDGEVRLSVADDGAGFDTAAWHARAPRGDRLGLIGMEQRARRAGGRLHVQSTPGGGTLISAVFPFAEQAAK